MLNIFLQSVLCFFIVYGVIQMGINIYHELNNIYFKKTDDIYIIITVKNQQDTIEGIIRSIVWKSLNSKRGGGNVPNILVVDMGSIDETPEILKRLCVEYDFIEVTDNTEYTKILEKLIK